MKQLLSIYLFSCLTIQVVAQTTARGKCIEGPPAKSTLEKRYIGGSNAFHKFISSNIVIPSNITFDEDEWVSLRLTIDKNGSLNKIIVIESIPKCMECTQEAIRLINTVPQWIPECGNGKGCRPYTFLVSIPFRNNK